MFGNYGWDEVVMARGLCVSEYTAKVFETEDELINHHRDLCATKDRGDGQLHANYNKKLLRILEQSLYQVHIADLSEQIMKHRQQWQMLEWDPKLAEEASMRLEYDYTRFNNPQVFLIVKNYLRNLLLDATNRSRFGQAYSPANFGGGLLDENFGQASSSTQYHSTHKLSGQPQAHACTMTTHYKRVPRNIEQVFDPNNQIFRELMMSSTAGHDSTDSPASGRETTPRADMYLSHPELPLEAAEHDGLQLQAEPVPNRRYFPPQSQIEGLYGKASGYSAGCCSSLNTLPAFETSSTATIFLDLTPPPLLQPAPDTLTKDDHSQDTNSTAPMLLCDDADPTADFCPDQWELPFQQ